MALRAGYYGVKRFLRNKLETIAGTYDETIKSLFPRSEQMILGSKNILNNKNIVSKESNGLTFTVNADKSVTVNGTATSDTSYSFFSFSDNVEIPEGNYILSDEAGFYYGGNDAAYLTLARKKGDGQTNYDITTVRSSHSKAFDVNYSLYNRFSCYLFIIKDTVLDNLTFKPMLRLASDPDDTYEPYAMTNRDLTASATDQKTAINAIITAATGAADFAAFKTAMGAITPVTRSLSLTKEDMTDEVKEDVEPEKTVTKKRTTKKTEEV